MIFGILFFLYMTSDFIRYYFIDEVGKGILSFILMNVSDIIFYCFILTWIQVIVTLSNLLDVINMKGIKAIIIIYLIIVEILTVVYYLLNYYDIAAIAHTRTVIITINALMVVYIMYICITINLKDVKNGKANSFYRKSGIIFNRVLLVYMVWIAFYDYFNIQNSVHPITKLNSDPLLLVYCSFSIYIIYYFKNNDPLKLRKPQLASDNAILTAVEIFNITKREEEVLRFVNNGMSNTQVADQLSISENTVKRHINSLFRKTNTQSRSELIFKIADID